MITIDADTFRSWIEDDPYFTTAQVNELFQENTHRLEAAVEMFLGDAFFHALDVAYSKAAEYILYSNM